MTPEQTAERARFEAWAQKDYPVCPLTRRADKPDRYDGVFATWAWDAWLAAKADATPGWKLVPMEPTPEIIAGAAVASWATASADDIAMARLAAPMVLMQLDATPGMTVDMLAGVLATMAPAYRAMLAAAPIAEEGKP